MNNKFFCFFISLMVMVVSVSYSQTTTLSTDTAVKILAHWKKGDSHSLKISKTSFNKAENTKNTFRIDAVFTIIEKDTSGYIVEWLYRNPIYSDADLMNIESNIFNSFVNQKIRLKLSLTGKFKNVLNNNELSLRIKQAKDSLANNSMADKEQVIFFEKLLTDTKVFNILLEHISCYFMHYGYEYKLNTTYTNEVLRNGLLVDKPYKAEYNTKLLVVDNQNNNCTIETKTAIDTLELKKIVELYLEGINDKKEFEYLKRKFTNTQFQFSQTITKDINFVKGIVNKCTFTQDANLFLKQFHYQNITEIINVDN